MSDSRREKIISAYWYDKRCICKGWERIVMHHFWRLTTMGNKREVYTLWILLKQVKSCHFSTEDLTMTYKVQQNLFQPLSLSWVQVLALCPWITANSRPTGLLAISWNSPSTFLSQGLCLCSLVWNGKHSPIIQKIPFLASFSSQIRSQGSLSWLSYIK